MTKRDFKSFQVVQNSMEKHEQNSSTIDKKMETDSNNVHLKIYHQELQRHSSLSQEINEKTAHINVCLL